ncbi:SAM-dependent methyltransferase [Ornithinicoccus hortensis]|uniref:SAM-dependent MidA family methyltransferase n=1 Tax=Ornithinicoccus hortensis TaxID=82346 RepID=A0A542YW84_9MICO|nr:SAM-dependent methyltransferase [Ornithinicoccus hortensis]TQL52234.1 SAM-dependent MidA family methyltransferase [Ornithinicoccus hortensis]
MTWTPWDDAWQQALYGPEGFYRRPEGPAGHFATSAQGLGPAGAVLAGAVRELAGRVGARTVVEVGAGRGELLTALAALPGAPEEVATVAGPVAPGPVQLLGVDVVPRPSGLPADVGWRVSPGGAALPEDLTGLRDVLVLAHEWLDVVPCPVVERDAAGVWHTVEVDRTGTERHGGAVAGADLQWLEAHVPGDVWRTEVGRPRDAAFADLTSRVDRGAVLVVDYGHTRAGRPPGGTLTAYRNGVQVPPVPDGSCDLTAHVAVDTLGADRLVRQRDALRDLLGPATLPPHELAGRDPAAYLAALARSTARTAITASGGPGDFWWALSGCGGAPLG